MPRFWYSGGAGPTYRRPMTTTITTPTVLRAGAGEITGDPSLLDRYLLDGTETDGRVALVEHTIAPKTLAAPLHRHSREDEYSFVLAGTLGVFEDGVEITASPGDLVFKPRGRWHTFWNAGDDAAAHSGDHLAGRYRGAVPPARRAGWRVRPADPARAGRSLRVRGGLRAARCRSSSGTG